MLQLGIQRRVAVSHRLHVMTLAAQNCRVVSYMSTFRKKPRSFAANGWFHMGGRQTLLKGIALNYSFQA